MRLYELTDALEAVSQWLDEHEAELEAAGGELPDELCHVLDALEGRVEEKVERIGLLIRQSEANAKIADSESDRLKALSRSYENRAKSLKAYLLLNLQKQGKRSVETPLVKVWLQANGRPSIRPLDPSSPPEEFTRVRIQDVCSPLAWGVIERTLNSAGVAAPAHQEEFDPNAAYEFVKGEGLVPEGGERLEAEGLVIERGLHVRTR